MSVRDSYVIPCAAEGLQHVREILKHPELQSGVAESFDDLCSLNWLQCVSQKDPGQQNWAVVTHLAECEQHLIHLLQKGERKRMVFQASTNHTTEEIERDQTLCPGVTSIHLEWIVGYIILGLLY